MSDSKYGNYTEEELEELEDKLREEDFEEREEEMLVDGKSVFEIDRIKREKKPEESSE